MCATGAKLFIFIVNILNCVVGLLLLVVATLIATKISGGYSEFLDYFKNTDLVQKVNVAQWLFLSVGLLVSLTSILGCCAVFMGKKWMFYVFAVLMSVFILVEVVGAIALLMFQGPALGTVQDELKVSLTTYGADPNINKVWDTIQKDLACCGIENATDWKGTAFGNSTSPPSAPDSCCEVESENCGQNKLVGTAPYARLNNEGCFTKFVEYAESNLFITGGVALGIAFIQILMVIAACFLGKKLGEDETV